MTTTISDEQVLLPCPFCGELPGITKHFREDIYGLVHRCKFAGPTVFEHADKNLHIRRWNTRAPDPRVVELVAADKEYDAMVARRNMYPCPGMDEHVVAARKRRAKAIAAMENDNG